MLGYVAVPDGLKLLNVGLVYSQLQVTNLISETIALQLTQENALFFGCNRTRKNVLSTATLRLRDRITTARNF